MAPVKRSPRVWLAVAGIAVVGAALLLVLVLRLAKVEGTKVKLSDPVFKIRPAARYANDIARHGPLLFQDPLNHDRDIVLSHQGTDADHGWNAFEARLPHDTSCRVTLDRATAALRDCHGAAVPPDGPGLVHYAVNVVKGTVEVDFRSRVP